jgi:hypothetical protein
MISVNAQNIIGARVNQCPAGEYGPAFSVVVIKTDAGEVTLFTDTPEQAEAIAAILNQPKPVPAPVGEVEL